MREGAAGNLPDAAAAETARLIDELVQQGGREGDLLLVLGRNSLDISGKP